MDPAIIVAIIGFLGGGWAVYERFTKMAMRRLFTPTRQSQLRRFIPLERVDLTVKALLSGTWVGSTEVRDDKENRKYRGRFNFKRSGPHELDGTIDVVIIEVDNLESERAWTLKLAAGFLNERTLVIDYWSEESNVYQFGTIILDCEDEHTFVGKFVARGRDLNRLIYGRARMKRSLGRR
jgi:hypothetical protein